MIPNIVAGDKHRVLGRTFNVIPLIESVGKEVMAIASNKDDTTIYYTDSTKTILKPPHHIPLDGVRATYVSVWDGGHEVCSPCRYNPDTKECTDIEDSGINPDGLEVMEKEFVRLPDDTELGEDDGVTFDY